MDPSIMPPQVEFWFEFASTYSYIAAKRIEHAAHRHGVDVLYRPFLLGPIFKQQGWDDSPFNIYPAKGRYMWRDLERLCEDEGIPFRKPRVFPRNGLLAARAALVIDDRGFSSQFVPSVYTANFAHDEDISDPDVLGRLIGAIGLDAREILDEAASEAIKTRLRLQTERAVSLGIFGAPAFVVDGELFWGGDRLERALQWALTARGDGGGSCGFPNDF